MPKFGSGGGGDVPTSVVVSERVQAKEVKVSDRMFFPNSRHAQEVIAIGDESMGGNRVLTFHAGRDDQTTRWTCGEDYLVRVERVQ